MEIHKPMQRIVDLDWVTYFCPCGASLCTRYASKAEVRLFWDSHREHTNGTVIETVTEINAP